MNEVEKRIDQYLDDIQSHLEFLSDDEKEEILISVRSHIDEQIAQRSQGQPTLEIIKPFSRKWTAQNPMPRALTN